MRVLVLTNMYPPHHYGGYELMCQDAVGAFRAEGHEVLVLTSDVRLTGVAAGDEPGVRRELKLYWDDHVVVEPSVRACLRIERANQAALARAVAEVRPDIVSVWHMGAMSIGLLTACAQEGLPLVHVICDDWLIYAPLIDRWSKLWRRRARPLAPVAARLLGVPCGVPDLGGLGGFCFISGATRRAAEEHGGWHFPRAAVVYTGVDVDEFPIGDSPARAEWGWRLLHVGRIDERKGIDTAIRALALLPEEATLAVVGRGDDAYLPELHRLVTELGLSDRVTFDVVERAALRDVYAAADVFVFAPRWAEPFGIVPVEAMACSTPVVATGTGGSNEFLVHEGNCLRFPVDDHEALAAAVGRLASEPELRRRLIDGGLATAAELTIPRWTTLLEAWHAAAAAGYPDGPPPDRPRIEDVLADRLPSPREVAAEPVGEAGVGLGEVGGEPRP